MNQKLIIEAYKSIEYKGGEKLGNITVQINPDSYKLSKSTSYKKDESIKEDKQLPEYKHTNPSTLSFDIHFDGTGIIPTGKKTVTERIKDLENKSRKTKRDGCEKRNAFIETKTKCASNLIRKVTVYLQNQSKTPSLYIKINGIQMDF